jgi:hypothetical protein
MQKTGYFALNVINKNIYKGVVMYAALLNAACFAVQATVIAGIVNNNMLKQLRKRRQRHEKP